MAEVLVIVQHSTLMLTSRCECNRHDMGVSRYSKKKVYDFKVCSVPEFSSHLPLLFQLDGIPILNNCDTLNNKLVIKEKELFSIG